MEYNLNREEAADMLWISTRTLDRRIRKWKLTHIKDWNKVMLSEEEIKNIKDHKQVSNVIIEWKTKVDPSEYVSNSHSSFHTKSSISKKIDVDEITKKLWNQINDSMWKFLEVLLEKDKKLEEKNQIIFSLQQKIGNIEWKLKNSMALPQYEEEKKEIILEKQNLEYENKLLDEKLRKEKIQNIALVWLILIFVIILIIIAFR